MIHQNYKLEFEGLVTFEYRKAGDLVKSLLHHNAIMAGAKQIVAERLANVPSSNIDSIKLYNGGLLVASKLIQQRSLPSATEVEFTAVFIESDFVGDFNEARLVCEAIGPFSGLTFPVQNKPADQQLAVTWKIKIL